MKKTTNLNLPVYDTPEVDTFKLNDWNTANETIDYVFGELKDGATTNAVDITARQDLVNVNSQLAEKMNKTIQTFEPTLVNGWVNYDLAGGNDALKYYKNDSGVLKIEGIITGGTSVYVCNLPFGFRPSRSKMIAGIAELNENTVPISIKIWNDGNIAILNWVSGMTKAIINGSIKL